MIFFQISFVNFAHSKLQIGKSLYDLAQKLRHLPGIDNHISLSTLTKFFIFQRLNSRKQAESIQIIEEPLHDEPMPKISEENDSGESSQATDKKSRFTLDYLEQKIGRVLTVEESEQLKKFIEKGDDRGIYSFLFGSGNNQTWPCQLCEQVIKGTMKQVTKHYAHEHQAPPLYPCQLCGKVIKSSHTYKRHRTAHLSEYKCPSCDKVFQDRSKLLAHKVAHSDSRPHVCAECGKQYKLASHLKSHVARSHLPESDRLAFTCEICGKRFSAKGNLTTHVQTTHSDSRPFVILSFILIISKLIH